MSLPGSIVRDADRVEIGHVRGLLLDPQSLDARWLEIDSADGCVLVPAVAASQAQHGELLVPYPASLIRAATHDPGAPLTAQRAAQLREHYGFTG